MIAESHKTHFGVLHKAQDSSLDVSSAGLPILDDIIVSFIITRHQETQRRREVVDGGEGQ